MTDCPDMMQQCCSIVDHQWSHITTPPNRMGVYQIKYHGDMDDRDLHTAYWNGYRWMCVNAKHTLTFGNHHRLDIDDYWRELP